MEQQPEILFGAGSTLGTGTVLTPVVKPVYEAPLFQGVVLALAAVYLLVLSRHLRDAYTLCKKLSVDPAKSCRMTEISGGTYARLLWLLLGIGLPLAVLLFLCAVDGRIPTDLPVAGLLAAAVPVAIVLFRVGLLRLTGAVALAQPITSRLVIPKYNYTALAVLLLAPLALLYLLTPPGQGGILLYAVLAGAGVLLILFLKETVSLFLQEKAPILHWFLYLCAVEILPVTFFCILAGRNW